MSKDRHEVAGQHLANVSIDEIFSNPAYMGIFRKFMSRTADEDAEQRDAYAMSLAMFEFWMDVQVRSTAPARLFPPRCGTGLFIDTHACICPRRTSSRSPTSS